MCQFYHGFFIGMIATMVIQKNVKSGLSRPKLVFAKSNFSKVNIEPGVNTLGQPGLKLFCIFVLSKLAIVTKFSGDQIIG